MTGGREERNGVERTTDRGNRAATDGGVCSWPVGAWLGTVIDQMLGIPLMHLQLASDNFTG